MSATEKQRAMPGLIASMVLFGTIGVFIRGTAMPSGVIAMARGLLGAAFLLLSARIRGRRGGLASVRKNAVLLLLSGLVLGMNWILLFEAYRYTTVATATVCYYLAPVLVVLTSPLFLGERLTLRKILAAAAAFTGMLFISGVTSAGLPAPAELRVKRIMAREGISEEYARTRVNSQHSDRWFRSRCDHTLENTEADTAESFSRRARAFFEELLKEEL